MTGKEADVAARSGVPIFFNGITYKRITEVGYWYEEKTGVRHPFVTMQDPSKYNSVTRARAEDVKLDSEVTEEERKRFCYD